LSNTSNRSLPSNAAATDSVTLLPGCWVTPRTAATASGTARLIGDRSQFEDQDPVGKFIGQARRDFQRERGLADSANPGQCHQPI
jgi:hypothetical protein